MPFSQRDTLTYRRDEKFGHMLLKPEEREKLLQSYLPPTPLQTANTRSAAESGFLLGARQFLKKKLLFLLFTLVHVVFSLYIRLRRAKQAVGNQINSVLFYNLRTPELIERDVKRLSKLPRHLSIILTLEEHGKGDDELEKLLNEAAEVAAWCAAAGICQLSMFEKTGTLKTYLTQTHNAMSQKLSAYFGSEIPGLTTSAPHMPPIENSNAIRLRSAISDEASKMPIFGDDGSSSRPPIPPYHKRHLSVLLISADDGRDSIVDLTKTLAEMAQRQKISPQDVTMDLVDTELSETVMGEPDLLVLFGPHIELQGYPPWQVRLSEIFHTRDNQEVGYQVFYQALCNYSRAKFNMGQ